MPHLPLTCPLREFYLAYELGNEPRGRPSHLHFFVERLLVGSEGLHHSIERLQCGSNIRCRRIKACSGHVVEYDNSTSPYFTLL